MVHNRSSWAFFLPGLNPRGIWLQCSLRTNIVCAILIRQQALYWNIGYVWIHTVCILYTLPSCLEDPIVLCFWLKWAWFFNYFHIFIFKLIWRGLNGFIQKKPRSIPTNWGVKVHLLYSIFLLQCVQSECHHNFWNVYNTGQCFRQKTLYFY